MTEGTNTIIADSAKTAAQAAETAASAVAATEGAKVESWAHKEWDLLKAKMHAVLAEMEAYVKSKS